MTSLNKLLFDVSQGQIVEVGDVVLPIDISEVDGLQDVLDSKVELPMSANDVIETTGKVFVTPQQRASIDSTASDVINHGQRLNNIEAEIDSLDSSDEKVKMNANDVSGYLEEKLDSNTLSSANNKLTAISLQGLTSTIAELNLLAGATGNIQMQINALTKLGNFTTSVDTYMDLGNLTPNINDMVIVLNDENLPNSPTSIYIFGENGWIYSGAFEGGQLRDFTTNPIDLASEASGILQKSKYEKQDAYETPFVDTDGNIVATDVGEALKEVFRFSDNIRKQWSNVIGQPLSQNDKLEDQLLLYQGLIDNIASVITAKGVVTQPYVKLYELPNKIMAIPNVSVEVGLNRTDKFTVTAPHIEEVLSSESFQVKDIAATLVKYEQGDNNVLQYDMEFNASDKSKFLQNEEVVFDGSLKLDTGMTLSAVRDDTWTDEGVLYSRTIDKSVWNSIDSISIRNER